MAGGVFSSALLNGMTIRESANDGSDFTNPAADYRRLFLGEDGFLHVKDSSGTVTDAYENTGGAGGLESGTSFPGGPSTDDLFYRTDRDLIYFYDGTRWLTANLYIHSLMVVPASLSATIQFFSVPPTELGYDVWMEDLLATMYASGLSGSAYWQLDLYTWDGSTQGSPIATVSNVSGTSSAFVRKIDTIDALLGTGMDAFDLTATKVSTPGNLIAGATLTYRLVG